MNLKKHYKLYKSGKLWITAAIATLALTTGVAATSTNALADTTNASAPQQNNSKNSNANADGNQAVLPVGKQASGADKGSAAPSKQNPGSSAQPSNNNSQAGKGTNNNSNAATKSVTEDHTFIRTVNFKFPDGKAPAGSNNQIKQSVTLTKTTQDKKVTWAPKDSKKASWGQISIPKINGYYAQVDGKWADTIDAQDFSKEQNPQNTTINVTYVASSGSSTDKSNRDYWMPVSRHISLTSPNGNKMSADPQIVWYTREKDAKTGKFTEWHADGKSSWDAWSIQPQEGYTSYYSIDGGKPVAGEEVPSAPAQLKDGKPVDVNVNVSYKENAQTSDEDNAKYNSTNGWAPDPQHPGKLIPHVYPPINTNDRSGNWAYIESIYINKDNTLHVSGWNASNQSISRPHHYIIILDRSKGMTEVGRIEVLNKDQNERWDVRMAHNVWNAAISGFNVDVPLNTSLISAGDKLQTLSRWTSDPAGNDGANGPADLYGSLYTMDYNTNNGSLDNFSVDTKTKQLHVAGWHASNQTLGKQHRFLILWDNTLGHEVQRIALNDNNIKPRPDVTKAYPSLLNANISGFDANFDLSHLDLTHSYQVISRYSTAANGEGSNVDYWFSSQRLYKGTVGNYAWLDNVSSSKPGQITVSGWHANDISSIEPNHFLILFDNTANAQLGAIKVTNTARPDVKSAYKSVAMAGQSGFSGTFDNIRIIPGHSISLVSRYSLSADGNGGDSAYTDYWMSVDPKFLIKDENKYYVDETSVNADGSIHLKGWMASGYSFSYPHAFLFIMDKDNKEVVRQPVNLTARPDVQKVYPNLYNAQTSGFDATIKLDAENQKKVASGYKIMMRFSAAEDGNPLANVANSTYDFWDAPLRPYIIPEKKPEQPTKPAKPQQPSSDNPNKGQTSQDTHNSGTTNPGKQTSNNTNTGKQTSEKGKDGQQQSQSGQTSDNGKDKKQASTNTDAKKTTTDTPVTKDTKNK